MAEIYFEIPIQCQPDELFEAITNERLISKWWLSGSQMKPELNEIGIFPFSDGDGHIRMKIIEISQGRKLTWECLEHKNNDWVGTRVAFEIVEGQEKNSCVLKFRHYLWTDTTRSFGRVSFFWASLYLRRLREGLQSGYLQNVASPLTPGNHFGFKVVDLDKAIELYKSLGFELQERNTTEAVLRCGNQFFSLDSSPKGDTYFDFNTPDIEAAKKQLLSNGCRVVFEVSPKKIFIKDPNGMNFRLCEP